MGIGFFDILYSIPKGGMMKKIVFVVIALMFVLSACSTPAPVATATVVPTVEPTLVSTVEPTVQPVEGITMSQLYEKYFRRVGTNIPETWTGQATMTILDPYKEGDGYLKVEINGNPETIIDDNPNDEYLRIYYASAWNFYSDPYYSRQNLFSNWYYGSPNHPNENGLIIFPTFNDEDFWEKGLAILNEYMLPEQVNISSWEGTKATLMAWRYPHFPSRIVENLITKEASPAGVRVETIDDDNIGSFFRSGSKMWGYVHIETDRYSGEEFIILTQSQPDPGVFERTQKYMQENFPELTYYGPYDTCRQIIFRNDELEDSAEVSEEEMIALCGVFYWDGLLNSGR